MGRAIVDGKCRAAITNPRPVGDVAAVAGRLVRPHGRFALARVVELLEVGVGRGPVPQDGQSYRGLYVPGTVRKDSASRFQPLIAMIAMVRSTSSFSLNCPLANA